MNGFFRRTRSSGPIVMILVAGFLGISILHLLLTIATSQSVYELADLKREKRELDVTSQILSEEVSSYGSQQNLLTVASKLGMVANSNPVFLKLDDQSVVGEPKPATDSAGQYQNLVANSAMINPSKTQLRTELASSIEPGELPAESPKPISAIPASPTR